MFIVGALEEAKKPNKNCDTIRNALMKALPVVAPRATPENLPAYEALANCLSSTNHFRTLLFAAHEMLDSSPGKAKPWFLPRALIGLGQFAEAGKQIERLEKLYPKDADLLAVKGLLHWSLHRWAELLATSDKLLALLTATTPSDPKAIVRARLLRLEALYRSGRLDDAEKELAAMEKLAASASAPAKVTAALADLRKRASLARRTELAADYLVQTPIPLGVYHLYGVAPESVGGALAALSLINFAKGDRHLRVEAEIPGVSERASQTITILKGQAENVRIAPALKVGFDVTSVRAPRPAQLVLKVTELDGNSRTLFDESYPVTLLPRDSLPLSRRVGQDNFRPTFEYSAAWVTPNAKVIDEFLTAAKKRAPRNTFAGEQTATVPQVKALYEELQSRGVSYVMDPALASVIGVVQRTRRPAEVLASTNAQCLEGTILFATLMEAIGLRPLIVFVPGHAFVGWHPTAQDGAGAAGRPVFLETTLVHDGKFEDAVRVAMKRVGDEEQKQSFKRGLGQILDVAELRKRGVTPQPFD